MGLSEAPFDGAQGKLRGERNSEREAPPRGSESDRGGSVVPMVKNAGEEPWIATRLDFLVNWSRANSLWPMPFGTACCAIEFMASAASGFDLARFGMERMSFSPRQADVLICAGRVPFKLAPVLRRIWQQMPQPKWAISMGACASTGGMFDNYAVVQGIDTIIPVDVYVPGCPPRPEGLMYGIMLLQKKVMSERARDKSLRNEMEPDPKSQLYIPPSMIDELSEPFGNSVHQTRSGL
jgi:NADH-quinone oxidoreductase subunit B